MDRRLKFLDRRHYETRTVILKKTGRLPSEKTVARLHALLDKKYGEGWKFECTLPGTVLENVAKPEMVEGTVLVFHRRKQLRDE